MRISRFLLIAATGLLLAASAVAQPGQAFTFVQLCDTQLGMGGYEQDKESFRLAVKQINLLKPDLVFICGDLVNDTHDDHAYADFNDINAGFAVPCYCTPGNHDVGTKTTAGLVERYIRMVDKDHQVIRHKGYTFVVTNTSLWKNQVPGHSEKHQAWFRETLEKASKAGSPVIVVGHYPPFIERPDEAEEYFNLGPKPRAEVLRLAKEHDVKAILAGHAHRNIITGYEGIPVVASASSSKNFDGAPRGFRLWHVSAAGALTHEYVPIEGAPPNPEK